MFERSRYMAGFYPAEGLDGEHYLTMVVKRTYTIDLLEAKCRVADEQQELHIGDVFNGDDDPFKSSLKFESDISPWKTRKDIVFIGSAHAPKGKPAGSWQVSLQVGQYKRSLAIFGPRTVEWVPPQLNKKTKEVEIQPPIIGEPEPVADVDLTYENAYGGFATYYPEDPKVYRKAIRKQKKKEKKKEEEQDEEEAKKLTEAEAAEAKKKEQAAKKAEEARQKGFFSGTGEADLADAPDVDFEIELGSTQRKAAGGTVVLDLAELAEAEAREAELEAERLADEVAKLAADDGVADDGAMKAVAGDLAELASELTEEALDEREAYERRLAKEGKAAVEDGAREITLADQGDEVQSDDTWISEQKRMREEMYGSLGLDANEEIQWEEGDFPRLPCPTNFVGKGFALRNCQESLDGLEMPQIEDPVALLKPEDLPIDPAMLHLPTIVPRPAGFGFIYKAWMPRSYLAGVLPHELEEAQHKMDSELVDLDPDDPDDEQTIRALMDRKPQVLQPEYYDAAHPRWQVKHLWGDEDVHLTHLDENGNTFFKLPESCPLVRFDRGNGWEDVEVQLDTLVIDRPAEQVVMVWRGRLAYDGPSEMDDWTRVDMDVQDFTLEELRDQLYTDELERARRDDNALILGEDEVSDEEEAEFNHRIMQAAIGLGGIAEETSTDAREERADDGALVDLRDSDREDVIMSDDQWIGDTKLALMSEEERKAAELARDEKKNVKAKKEAIKKKLEDKDEERRKKEEEEAAKKKKKKKEEPPPHDDDDDDPDDGGDAPADDAPAKKAPPAAKKKRAKSKSSKTKKK